MEQYEFNEIKSQINDLCISYFIGDLNKSEELAYKITKLFVDLIEAERINERKI